MRRKISMTLFSVALASLGLAGCDLDVPDLNNAPLEGLEDNPTAPIVSSACTGLLIGTRAGTAAANGYVSQLGILGRESYNFDGADPRYIGEMLEGELVPSSPFGGAFWGVSYTNIRLANIILKAVDVVEGFDDAQRQAIRGFVHTIKAMDHLRIIVTHDTTGAVIDTDREIGDLGPIAPRDDVYDFIAQLLDDAVGELTDAGEIAFPFALSSGFVGFDTPATFIEFNRALAARVDAYREDYEGVDEALAASFLDPAGDLRLGTYYAFSTGNGDLLNNLTNRNIYAHPSWETDAEVNEDTDLPDARFREKIRTVAGTPEDRVGTGGMLTSNLKFTMYTVPDAPVPIIRNEELILLRAESRWAQGDLAGAIEDLNNIRVRSGELTPLDPGLSADEVEDQILYNRRYSLMFEGGHRWIDARRFAGDDVARLAELLPLDRPMHFLNIRYPIPAVECDGRPGEAACDIDSSIDL
jgi:starch-binding outer membrane protein, SusD/RagB family